MSENKMLNKGFKKKGQVTLVDLAPLVIAFVVVVVVLSISGEVVQQTQDTIVETISITENNRSHTFVGDSVIIAGSARRGFTSFNVNSINNFTNNTVETSNYAASDNGSLRLGDGATSGDSAFCPSGACTVNVSYSYSVTHQTTALNATDEGLEGVGNFSEQTPLLATILVFTAIIAAVILIPMLIRKFGSR